MKRIIYVVLIIGIIFIGSSRITSIVKSSGNFIETLKPIFYHPFATYDEKMVMRYPIYYNFIQDIKKVTPENSTIYLTEVKISRPQLMWAINHIQITQTMLYPRNIKRFELNNTPLKNNVENTYAIIFYNYPNSISSDSKLIATEDNTLVSTSYYSEKFNKKITAKLIVIE